MTQLAPINYPFDISAIDPYVGGGAPFPSGTYRMEITAMEVKANNDAASGHNLALEYTVLDGELKGRKFFENLNLWHQTSTAAVEIANKQLSSIGHAVGILTGTDPTILAFKPMLVEIELTAAQPDKISQNTGETIKGRGPQNRVVKRAPIQSAPVPGAAAAAGAPAFNPAAQQQMTQSQAPTQVASQSQAPAFGAPAQQTAAPAATGGPAAPPWQK